MIPQRYLYWTSAKNTAEHEYITALAKTDGSACNAGCYRLIKQ